MTDSDIAAHCAEIERCNQRGGRMLSIVDLIEAGTITEDAAAYSLAAIGNNASFMTGALPGGAGKTTVMGALLNMIPNDVRLAPADGTKSVRRGLKEADRKHCYICHEISAGNYYAYLWGEPLRQYFELPEAGHMLATNLHADDYNQARAQICDENGVPEERFRRINLIYFLRMKRFAGHVRRIVDAIWESDGINEHRKIYSNGMLVNPGVHSRFVPDNGFKSARNIINSLADSDIRTIEEVRRSIVYMRNKR